MIQTIEYIRVTVRCGNTTTPCEDTFCTSCRGQGRYVKLMSWDEFVAEMKEALRPPPDSY